MTGPRRCLGMGVLTGLVVVVLLGGLSGEGQAQQSYARGQNVAPAYEGWERNDDGSYNLVFGYMNRNWEEEVHVEVGPGNRLDPGGPDLGQPTRFHPRRNRFVFRVRVPADFGDQEVVWTLTTNGVTERAYGTLRRDYFIDDFVVQANYGAGGAAATTPELSSNEAPTLEIEGGDERRVRVGEPLSLVAHSVDDGKPRARPLRASAPGFPGRITTDSATGHRLSWLVYRGGGTVTFDPTQIKTWEDTRDGQNSPWSPGWSTPEPPEDGRWATMVTFDTPGTYVLRAIAHDGGLDVRRDVTVVVD